MPLSLSVWPVIVSLALAQLVVGSINFKGCQGPIDLGGTEKRGDIQHSCIKDHNFKNRTHAWILRNSIIRRTNFTSCTFRDTEAHTQNFNGSTWENVIFHGCRFTSGVGEIVSQIMFEHVSFFKVKFINCTFDASADVVFSQFAFHLVTFRACHFKGRLIFQLGELWRVAYHHSSFGTNETRTSLTERHPGDMIFSKMTLKQIQFYDNDGGTNELVISAADVTEVEISRTTMSALRCHRLDTTDADALKQCMREDECSELGPALFKDLLIFNSTFKNGIYCEGATFSRLQMRRLVVQNAINFSNAQIDDILVEDVKPIDDNVTSDFSLESATLRNGRKLAHINTTNVTYAETSFMDAINFIGLNFSSSSLNVAKAIFSQELIGNECCTIGCFLRGCYCNLTESMTIFCPQGNASVSLQAQKTSCFPASASLWVREDPDTEVRRVRMGEVRIGDIAVGRGGRSSGSVFFFGHRDSISKAKYVTLVAREHNNTLRSIRLSPGHLLPVWHKGNIEARHVQLGDWVYTVDGRATVIDIGMTVEYGMYAPVTMSGEMIVDGVVVSCFTSIVNERVATALLAPLRWVFVKCGPIGQDIVARADFLHERSAAGFVEMVDRFVARLRTLMMVVLSTAWKPT